MCRSGSVAALAVDPLRHACEHRLRTIRIGRDLRIRVVTEHAIVSDRASEAIVMGTIVALLPSRQAALALAGGKVPERATGFASAVPSSVALREGHD